MVEHLRKIYSSRFGGSQVEALKDVSLGRNFKLRCQRFYPAFHLLLRGIGKHKGQVDIIPQGEVIQQVKIWQTVPAFFIILCVKPKYRKEHTHE